MKTALLTLFRSHPIVIGITQAGIVSYSAETNTSNSRFWLQTKKKLSVQLASLPKDSQQIPSKSKPSFPIQYEINSESSQPGKKLCILSSLRLQLGARLEGSGKVGGGRKQQIKPCREAELPEKSKSSLQIRELVNNMDILQSLSCPYQLSSQYSNSCSAKQLP